jgi:hypothetical protein
VNIGFCGARQFGAGATVTITGSTSLCCDAFNVSQDIYTTHMSCNDIVLLNHVVCTQAASMFGIPVASSGVTCRSSCSATEVPVCDVSIICLAFLAGWLSMCG